jgi:hypothetical protein
MFVANGTPALRIWRAGTRRVLGVVGGEQPAVPDFVRSLVSFRSNLYADFTVCPLTRARSREMQLVCVESAEHLVVETLDESHNPIESHAVNLN